MPADGGVVPSPLPLPLQQPGRHSRSRSPSLLDALLGWVRRRLPTLAGAIGFRGPHLTVLLMIAALGLAATAWWTLRTQAAPLPVAHTSAPTASSTPTASMPAPSGVAEPATTSTAHARTTAGAPEVVVVDVTGKVRRPGVLTLPVGSRVIDALRRAGGARPGTRLASLNLARVLVDGEQILVGTGPPRAATSSPESPGAASPNAPVSLNSAGLDALEALPGVGPVTAQKILDWRTEHGPFSSVDELLEVDGIGPKTLADLAPLATL